jgi:hypothetical protein
MRCREIIINPGFKRIDPCMNKYKVDCYCYSINANENKTMNVLVRSDYYKHHH